MWGAQGLKSPFFPCESSGFLVYGESFIIALKQLGLKRKDTHFDSWFVSGNKMGVKEFLGAGGGHWIPPGMRYHDSGQASGLQTQHRGCASQDVLAPGSSQEPSVPTALRACFDGSISHHKDITCPGLRPSGGGGIVPR